MQDEIYAGLKNAIDRGASIEEAVQSLVSAGYNPMEVREAAKLIETGASQFIISGSKSENIKEEDIPKNQEGSIEQLAKERTAQAQAMALPVMPAKKKGGRGVLIVAIILSALILIGGIGLLVYIYLIK
jgi:hypothetical protein